MQGDGCQVVAVPAHVGTQAAPLAAHDQSEIAGQISAKKRYRPFLAGETENPDSFRLQLFKGAGEVHDL